jgi:hypothetical protein
MVFLDQHAGALQAIFAFVVSISTVVYVRYTKRMWTEMRETNRQLKKADVQIGFEVNSAAKTIWDLVVRNTGNVALLDLVLSVDPPDFPGIGGKSVGHLGIFTRPIPVLLPKGEIKTAFLNLIPAMHREDGRLTFRAQYRTPLHPETVQEFTYDLKAYEGLGYIEEAMPDDFLKALTEIGRTLNSLNRSVENLSDELRAEVMGLQTPGSEQDLRDRLQGFVGAWRDTKVPGDESFLGFSIVKLRSQSDRLADRLSESALDHPILGDMRLKLRQMANMHFYGDGGESLGKFVSLGDDACRLAETYLVSTETT